MAKDGSVAPKERISVTFKPTASGAQEEIELPLKLMVLGDFTQRADERSSGSRGAPSSTSRRLGPSERILITQKYPKRSQPD